MYSQCPRELVVGSCFRVSISLHLSLRNLLYRNLLTRLTPKPATHSPHFCQSHLSTELLSLLCSRAFHSSPLSKVRSPFSKMSKDLVTWLQDSSFSPFLYSCQPHTLVSISCPWMRTSSSTVNTFYAMSLLGTLMVPSPLTFPMPQTLFFKKQSTDNFLQEVFQDIPTYV